MSSDCFGKYSECPNYPHGNCIVAEKCKEWSEKNDRTRKDKRDWRNN